VPYERRINIPVLHFLRDTGRHILNLSWTSRPMWLRLNPGSSALPCP
jgi:hypothetical protein